MPQWGSLTAYMHACSGPPDLAWAARCWAAQVLSVCRIAMGELLHSLSSMQHSALPSIRAKLTVCERNTQIVILYSREVDGESWRRGHRKDRARGAESMRGVQRLTGYSVHTYLAGVRCDHVAQPRVPKSQTGL
jgi:hypothetical protein